MLIVQAPPKGRFEGGGGQIQSAITVIPIAPINFFNSSSEKITFSCIVSDLINVSNTTLYGSWGNAWHDAEVNTTDVNHK